MSLNLKYIFTSIIIVSLLIFSSIHLIYHDLMFHTDIARDFLLMEDMINSRSPDLIGPRAGGIPGLFFGPIWYYALIPVLVIGQGNPLYVGVSYVIIVAISIYSVFWSTRKIFGVNTAFLSSILYTIIVIPLTKGFTQSFGSLIFSPIIFYLLYKYSETIQKRYLVILVFVLGIVFHLQPAFAMLSIFLSFVFTTIISYRAKKLSYVSLFLLILIPLSNYILFELRNNFIQIHSFANFLLNPPAQRSSIEVLDMITNRIDGMLGRLNVLGTINIRHNIVFLFLHLFILFKAVKDKKTIGRNFYFIFYSFYVGFWVLSLLFKGFVWDYYHWAFLPLIVILFTSLFNLIPKKIFLFLYLVVVTFTFIQSKNMILGSINTFSNYDSSSWSLNKEIAQSIFNDSKTDFGYYVYSTDEFGFPVKYALNYIQKSQTIKGDLCVKKPVTYLIYYPTPTVGAKTDPRYWKEDRVKILGAPVESKEFGDGIIVEKYILDDNQISEQSDPNIICNLHFR